MIENNITLKHAPQAAFYRNVAAVSATSVGLVEPTASPRLLNRRSKVIIGHPHLGRGGSESTVMWLIEALKQECDVTVMTTGGWDRTALNAFYGTKVREDDVKIRIAPVPWLLGNRSAAALRGSCYQRCARHIASEYDLRISTYNLTDWGLPAIHFLADFSWNQELRQRLDPPSPGFIYRDSVLRRTYLRIASSYQTPSGRDVLHEDRLIANSKWTADMMRRFCGVNCAAVVHPPIWTEFPDIPWHDKEPAFVMIGRIAPEKQIERAIAILDTVRQRGHAIRFHLCGRIPNDTYGKGITRLCRQHCNWIVPEGQVSGENKANVLARCRFGIQTRGAEPFGISVAEMIRAGAIVFAPSDGGQTEILDHPNLLFASVEDAAEKISDALSNSHKQEALRTHLARRSQMFGAQVFIKQSIEVIAGLARIETTHISSVHQVNGMKSTESSKSDIATPTLTQTVLSKSSQPSRLASWRMSSAVATQGISGDEIYAMIEPELAELQLKGVVLDYGSGAGNLTRRLLQMPAFDEVFAADLLSCPSDMQTSHWLQQDLNDAISGYDDYFDVVIASEVIEHLENSRFTARELYRLCRPGGCVIITTPNNESIRSLLALAIRGHFVYFDKGWYPGHITPLVRKDLFRILVEAGFEPIGFRFSATGSLPGLPTRTWQQLSFGLLHGLRFSNNLLVSARKPLS